jgi:hypothetical protein
MTAKSEAAPCRGGSSFLRHATSRLRFSAGAGLSGKAKWFAPGERARCLDEETGSQDDYQKDKKYEDECSRTAETVSTAAISHIYHHRTFICDA